MSCSPVFIIAAIVFMLHDTDIAQAASACNTNDHCIPGWICAGGIAQNGNANYKGYCKPNVVLRQLCNIHQIAEGKFARVATLMAIVFLGIKFFTGPREVGGISFAPFVITMIGTGFIFGSFQLVAIITQSYRPLCQFKDM